MRRKSTFLILLLLFWPFVAFSQEIVSAERFLAVLARSFEEVQDYEAEVTITQEQTASHGTLYYKSPYISV